MHSIILQNSTALLLIALAAASRLVPHPPNFSPLNAVALFSAAYLPGRILAILVPLVATFLSDLVLNNTVYAAPDSPFIWGYPGMLWQYCAYLLIVLLGFGLIRPQVGALRVAVGVMASGAVFFLVSNFGVWYSGGLYPLTTEGLITCYVAALPFYRNMLCGDTAYAILLFGGFALLRRSILLHSKGSL